MAEWRLSLKRAITKRTIEAEKTRALRKINEFQHKIEEIKDQIGEYEKKLVELNRLELELEEYEKKPISERTMRTYLSRDTGTVALMDKFESLNEKGFKKYERMLIIDWNQYSSEMGYYLFVERRKGRDVIGGITMTDFKLGYTSKVNEHARAEIDNYLENGGTLENGQIIMFKTCYLLRAQNSSNRTGYGNIYYGDELVHEGTLYGETTSYVFAGVQIIVDERYRGIKIREVWGI